VLTGQLTREDIAKGEADPNYRLKVAEPKVRVPEAKRRTPRYTPVSRRQDRPNAILWLVRNHPELKDAAIMRLVGTTKPTIAAIRDRTHWNSTTLTPLDPVTLGLCSQIELDMEVEKAAKDRPQVAEPASTLLPVEETTSENALDAFQGGGRREEEAEIDADAVFAKLNALPRANDEDEDDAR
jgi:hypothetical protein